MDQHSDQVRQEALAKLKVCCDERLSKSESVLMKKFLDRLSIAVAVEDFEGRTLDAVFQQMLSFWKFFSIRKPHETKLRVFNPTQASDHWVSPHSVIMMARDDMPFLVDSLRMELEKQNLHVHLIMHIGDVRVNRDAKGQVTQMLNGDSSVTVTSVDAVAYIEIDRQVDPSVLVALQEKLDNILLDVAVTVQDWQPMRDKLQSAIVELDKTQVGLGSVDAQHLTETRNFLQWLDTHFIFFGYREYQLIGKNKDKALKVIEGSSLGVLRDITEHTKLVRPYSEMSIDLRAATESSKLLIIAKTNTISTVHRHAYTDLISIRFFNAVGEMVKESRFVGLYTSQAYNSSPLHIPFLRHKVVNVMKASELPPKGHSGKALLHILETFPRDDLFQINTDELTGMAMGILHLQERPRTKVFIRRDLYGRFYSCFVFVLRDRFDHALSEAIGNVLMHQLKGLSSSFSTFLSDDSSLMRLHYVVRVKPEQADFSDFKFIEKEVIAVARSWEDDLHERLILSLGEASGILVHNKYRRVFSASYKENYSVDVALEDIALIDRLSDETPLVMKTYQAPGEGQSAVHLRLFRRKHPIPLCDVLPLLENMGLKVMGERPVHLSFADKTGVWINDFHMQFSTQKDQDIEPLKSVFEDAFLRVWEGEAENDRFNQLVIFAKLSWKEITVLRAYAKYLRQIGFNFSQAYIGEALVNNALIAAQLIDLFKLRFMPGPKKENEVLACIQAIEAALDKVASLDEDRILRRFLEIIELTVRTNYFQKDKQGQSKSYIAFKIKLEATKILISELPLPLPMCEIFVYSSRVEGVHLRMSKVSRGGLRWSDRREDFRTEVLGLMKAQQVKNAIIVPAGAKGGFVPKLVPPHANPDEILKHAISCYRTFISALLDVTDNVVAGQVVHPIDVVRYDEDDSYLVVAADKGTASFSDYANDVSKSYNFWLGDAFASGGSVGYDHKKMGITARGAWESVKRHFYRLGLDPDKQDITVVGIGDMAGDVFGNGMLLSKHIKLVAAFNDMHIFIDPNPDPAVSFEERKRLFNLPRSAWSYYDKSKMSKGGGIYERSAKSILLSPEAREVLGIDQESLTPFELMKCLLEAPVDLLWNGGIGTYVKSVGENHQQVGDRANDLIRTDGKNLRCKVVGEGGNLGFTQLGRVEYALQGGLIYTDFVDNSAGVNCSDHEVNIKILLNDVVSRGLLTEADRNVLLPKMTEEIAELVLDSNFQQTHAINLSTTSSPRSLDLFSEYIRYLEKAGKLNRALEFLPDTKGLAERKSSGKSLVQPEIAVLVAYSKNTLKAELLLTNLPDDDYFLPQLYSEFPKRLFELYPEFMKKHMLRREIIATQLINDLVNHMGVHFVYRLQQETGAPLSAIVSAYSIAEAVFDMHSVWGQMQALGSTVPTHVQYQMMMQVSHIVRRSTRWILRNLSLENINIQNQIDHFKKPLQTLLGLLPSVLPKVDKDLFRKEAAAMVDQRAPEALADRVCKFSYLLPAFDIIEAASIDQFDVGDVAKAFFLLGQDLKLDWMSDQLKAYTVTNTWEELSRTSLRDDLDFLQRKLSVSLVRMKSEKKTLAAQAKAWFEKHALVLERWSATLSALEMSREVGLIKYSVAIRALLDIAQACEPSTLVMMSQ